jgi:GNAT superfamily N-acetyltransferase
METKGPWTIRLAEPSDLSSVIRLIRGIADYERMRDAVVLDPDILEEALFERHEADVLIASINGKDVGFALYFNHFSTFLGRTTMYLEDLFVDEAYRGHGIGKALFLEVARRASDNGQTRMDWVCLSWNTPSLDFYRSLGASVLEDWRLVRLEDDALKRLVSVKDKTTKGM